MLNLIVNAVEAMGAQDAGARDLVISSARTKSGGVLVAVRDRGPGVNPTDLERIFEAFYSTKADGLGMGLSICRTISRRMVAGCGRPGAPPGHHLPHVKPN
jgi:signal transduction histidine kinase